MISSARPQVQFLQAFLVFFTSQFSLFTKVGLSKSTSVKRVDSSIVGGAVPFEVGADVNAHKDALAAREVRRGKATDPVFEEVEDGEVESIDEEGRFSDSGTEDATALPQVNC
jgi:hypothetical protein